MRVVLDVFLKPSAEGIVAFDVPGGGAGVTGLASHDFSGDGLHDIVVGRADGMVQVGSPGGAADAAGL